MSGLNHQRSLDRLARTAAASRVLNLHEVEASFGQTDAYLRAPMFACKRLNEAIILKHALRAHDRAYVQTSRATATKVIFPISRADLRLGGYSFFVEQVDCGTVLRQAVGHQVSQADLNQDLELLRAFASLPTLDPYLLRDATQRLGRDVADCYFNISETDIRAVQRYLRQDMRALAARAFNNDGGDTTLIANRLSHYMLDDPGNTALAPLRKALKFEPEAFQTALKGWKGMLYYKWSYQRLYQEFPDVAREMASMRTAKASGEDKVYIYGLVKKIIAQLETNLTTLKRHIDGYDQAFAALVKLNDPKPFQIFLDKASQSFAEIGRAVGEISHTCDFWAYRKLAAHDGPVDITTAHEIIGELAHALGLRYDKELNA